MGKVLEQFVKANQFVEIIRGPLGAGKTKAAAFKVFQRICSQKAYDGVRRSRWAVIRNTFPDLKSTTIRDWKEIVPVAAGPFTMGHPPEHKLSFDLEDGTRVEAEVLFIALDREEHVRKLRGMQLTGVWFNETKELVKSVIDMALSRVDRYPGPGMSAWVGGIGDTNAWDQDHWLNELYEEWQLGKLPGWEFFTQPPGVLKVEGEWIVNPLAENLMVLRADYYQRQIAGKTEDWIRVNLANEIGLSFDGKPVHPEYSDAVHGIEKLWVPTSGTVIVGLDFGLTPAAVFLARDAFGRWIAFDEIVTEDVGAPTFADLIKRKCAEYPGVEKFVFIGDPSGDNRDHSEQSYFQILAANGVVARKASTNDPSIRRAALSRPLMRLVEGKPGFMATPKVRKLRKALAGGFHYKRVAVQGKESMYRDEPVKDIHSHVGEACEYGLLDAGEHAVVNASNARNFPTRPVVARADWDVFAA